MVVHIHNIFNKAPRLFCTCGAHELAKLCAEHVEDADAASHQQDEVQDGGVAQQLVRVLVLNHHCWYDTNGIVLVILIS